MKMVEVHYYIDKLFKSELIRVNPQHIISIESYNDEDFESKKSLQRITLSNNKVINKVHKMREVEITEYGISGDEDWEIFK